MAGRRRRGLRGIPQGGPDAPDDERRRKELGVSQWLLVTSAWRQPRRRVNLLSGASVCSLLLGRAISIRHHVLITL
jgi:hypothetical protein